MTYPYILNLSPSISEAFLLPFFFFSSIFRPMEPAIFTTPTP